MNEVTIKSMAAELAKGLKTPEDLKFCRFKKLKLKNWTAPSALF